MIIQRLFSKKDSNKTRNSVIAGSGLIGSETVILDPLNNKLLKNINKRIKSNKNDKESNKLYKN